MWPSVKIISKNDFLPTFSLGISMFVGIDVHNHSYHLALRRVDGRALSLVIAVSPQSVADPYQSEHTDCSCAYEPGSTGFSLARMLLDTNIPVIVAAHFTL